MGCPFVPQSLRLSHLWIPRVFFYSWLLPHGLLNKKMGFSDFLFGVFSIALIVVTSHDSFVECWLFSLPFRVFVISIPLSTSWCWIFMSEYFFYYHVLLYLDFLLECVWVVVCVILFEGIEIFVFVVLVLFWVRNSEIFTMFLSPDKCDQDFLWVWGMNIHIYSNDLDLKFWALNDRPHCELSMSSLIKLLLVCKT